MPYNPDIHHRRSIRLKEFDYSSAGAYFVTICTHGRECLFGDVFDGEMCLNAAGKVVEALWAKLPERFPNVTLDEFSVMPNHFHGIIYVGAPLAAPCVSAVVIESKSEIPGRADGAQGVGAASSAPTLGAIMRVFKSISAIDVNRILNRYGCPLWQRNYYERLIRNDIELFTIREYIHFNPANWADDEENPNST